MRLSFSTLACPAWSLPQIVGAASAHGFDGIDPRGIGPEIDVTRLAAFADATELAATIDLLRAHGLGVPCLNTSIALVTTAPERWLMMLDEARRHADLAARLDTPFVRIFGGAVPRGMTRTEAATMARRHLTQLVRVCRGARGDGTGGGGGGTSAGCTVLLETHDEWCRAEQVMELLADFEPEEAAALWDVEQTARSGEPPAETARALGRYLRHVHLKDSVRGADGRNVPRLLGQGDLPLDEAMAALRSIGYDGWLCLETEKRWFPREAPEPDQSLPQFVAWVRRHQAPARAIG